MFWRWPIQIRSLSKELDELKAQYSQLKEDYNKLEAGQIKLVEWVKVTHRLHRAPEGIRALIQSGKRLIPLVPLIFMCQCLLAQPFPPILRQPLTTNGHFGPVPIEGEVPIWNATVKKWSNGIVSAGASTPHTWTNDNGTLKPIAFPTNILLRVNVPDDGVGTNFYFDSRVYRTNARSKLFSIYNGGSNALTIGPNGQLMAGRNNGTPLPGAVLYGIYDTALGETNQQEIFTLSGNSTVGYSGAADLIIDTNYGALILFANKEGGTKFTRFSVQAGAGDNPQNFNSFTMQMLVDGSTYMQMDPNFTLLTPTNYLFSSSIRITNTHTLMSLQNSNFPVFEVDGVGDLRLLKKIPYLWPSAQGAAGTVLTNNGSGTLGWGILNFQPASANLTNWANIPTGAMANVVSTTFLTNWANSISNLTQTKQNGSAVLTNLVGTVANNVTNFVSLSTTNATSKPLTNSYTAGVLTMFGLEAGSGLGLIVNSSNIVPAADWAQIASVTNVNGVSNWVNSVSNLAQTKQLGSENLTNWSNIPTGAMANVVATTFLTNWANAISNLANTKQFGSATLTNLSGTGAITNLFSLSLSNATLKPIVFGGVGNAAGMTNTTGQIYGLEAGANITLTPNGSNVVIAASVTGGSVTFSDLVWTNNGTQILPNAFPTNILLRVNTPDDGIGTNFYFDAQTRRIDAASKLFTIRNGGTNALTIGRFGNLSIGAGKVTPVSGRVFDQLYQTDLGEPSSSIFQIRNARTTTGYRGDFTMTITTNSSFFTLSANNGTAQSLSRQTMSFTNAVFNLLVNDGIGSGDRGVILSPGIDASSYPTNFLFSSFYILTANETLFSLQNAAAPVFEVDGLGDLKLLKGIAYSWPNAQGAAGTVLTNNGSGALGWGSATAFGLTTNANQFFGVPLSIKDGALVTNLVTYGGSPALTVIPKSGANSNSFQVMNPSGLRIVYVETNDVFVSSNTFIRGYVNDLQGRTRSYTYNNLSSQSNAVSTISSNTAASSAGWTGVCWSPELATFVAVASSGANRVMTSSNGINWISRSAAEANAWLSVTWAPEIGLFCAVANSGTHRVMTSPDGVTWGAQTAADDALWNDIVWAPDLRLFVSIANVAGAGGKRVMTSADGTNWFGQTDSHDAQWASLTWSPELHLFVAGGGAGADRFMSSPDGTNWTTRTGASDDDMLDLCWSPELRLFCAVCDTANSGVQKRIQTSPDGINWTAAIKPVVTNDWRTVTWSPELGVFLAMGIVTDRAPSSVKACATSSDGINWQSFDLPENNEFNDVCWSPELGMFCAVSDSGTFRVVTTKVIPTTRSIAYVRKIAENRVSNLAGMATNLVTYPTSDGTAPALTVTNIPGIGTNSFQVLNTNGVPVIYALTNNGITLVTSNALFLGAQTNASRVDVAGGHTNWIGAESKGTFYASSNLTVKAGQSVSNVWVGGVLFRSTSATAFTNLNSTVTTFTNASQYIVPAHTLTNNNDTVITEWTGNCLSGTNNIRIIYGYQTVMDTGLFTNLVTSWRAGMTVSRTAGVGGHADAWFAFSALGPVSAGSFASSGYYTNLELTCTNGVDVTNVLQLASRKNGGISNNTMVVRWEPASK